MDENVDAFAAGVLLEDGECGREDAVDLCAVGELGVDDRRGAARGADGVEGGGGRVRVAQDEDEVGAGLCEGEGDCGADS